RWLDWPHVPGRNSLARLLPPHRRQIRRRAPNAQLPKNSRKSPPKILPSGPTAEAASTRAHEIDKTESRSQTATAFRSCFLDNAPKTLPSKRRQRRTRPAWEPGCPDSPRHRIEVRSLPKESRKLNTYSAPRCLQKGRPKATKTTCFR